MPVAGAIVRELNEQSPRNFNIFQYRTERSDIPIFSTSTTIPAYQNVVHSISLPQIKLEPNLLKVISFLPR